MFENRLLGDGAGFKISFAWGHISVYGEKLPHNQSITRIGDPNIELIQGWIIDNVAFLFCLGANTGTGYHNKRSTV